MLRLGPKAYLFRQGDPPTSAFLIEEGHVEVVLESDGTDKVLAVRGPGDIIGEMAIVDRVPRCASVRTIDDCVFLPITAAQLERRLANADAVTRMVLNVVLNRFRATLSNRGRGLAWVESSYFRHDPVLVNAAAAELRMERDIDDALNRDEIEPHYQAIIRLSDGKLVGFEALARWKHPVHGFIPPLVFVPIMEANGRSADLTLHCMRSISRDFPVLMNSALSNFQNFDRLHVNLNVSARDLRDEKLVKRLAEIADQAGISAGDVHLELTETGLVQTPDGEISVLHMACDRGFSVAIDDFGTGYSTMASLRNTPACTLKIDRSFVRGLGEGGANLPIVRNILQLAESLGMRVVGEGIETAAEASMLRQLGCDFGQGYAFGRAQPIEHCAAFVRSWKCSSVSAWNSLSSQVVAHVA
jgi:EAL domain-containing protein (putative c-di-GMP-specific phosphodiesterase class I)